MESNIPQAPKSPRAGVDYPRNYAEFSRGFKMMLPALTTLIGFAGQTDLFARIVAAPRRGA